MYTDDPIADAYAYDYEQAKALEKYPTCYCCGEHIVDNYLYDIDGDLVCEECLKEHYRKSTYDYIDED